MPDKYHFWSTKNDFAAPTKKKAKAVIKVLVAYSQPVSPGLMAPYINANSGSRPTTKKATKATSVLWNKLALRGFRFGFHALDQRLLRNHPRIWVGRYHVAVCVALTVALLSVFSIEISEAAFDFIDERLDVIGTREITAIAIVFGIILAFIVFGVALIRAQARNIHLDRKAPGALTGAVLHSSCRLIWRFWRLG
mgnify:CR=1 FL=1